MNARLFRFIVPLLIAGASIAGCGSSSSSSTTSAAAAAGTSSTTASSTSSATSSSAAAGTSVVIRTKHDKKLGTILAAGDKKLTVYLFERDKGSTSACTGSCAAAWPPVTGKASVEGAAKSEDLGTIKRADGRTQVTYHGHPLYFFVKDKDDEDAYGQGVNAFGADWYVMAPSGNKVDES